MTFNKVSQQATDINVWSYGCLDSSWLIRMIWKTSEEQEKNKKLDKVHHADDVLIGCSEPPGTSTTLRHIDPHKPLAMFSYGCVIGGHVQQLTAAVGDYMYTPDGKNCSFKHSIKHKIVTSNLTSYLLFYVFYIGLPQCKLIMWERTLSYLLGGVDLQT